MTTSQGFLRLLEPRRGDNDAYTVTPEALYSEEGVGNLTVKRQL